MKIGAINNFNTKNISFGNVKSLHDNVKEAVFNKFEGTLDYYSNLKGVDLFALKYSDGCAVNPSGGYLILVQNQIDGTVIKEFRCKENQKDIANLNKQLMDYLM